VVFSYKADMENYDKYVSEIKKLEIKSEKRFPHLSHFNVIKNKPPEELEILMIYALGDLALLPSEEIKQELAAVKQMEKVFSKIDTNYPGLFKKFQNGTLGIRELKLRLKPLFKFIRLDPEIITSKFMVGLYISILNKKKSILTFKNKIKDLLGSRPLQL
jgi:hypothetical protein